MSHTFTIDANPALTNTFIGPIIRCSDANVQYFCGLQLEPGPVATPFEHRPIGLELSLCQRYYQKYAGTHYAWNNNKESESLNRIYTVATHCPLRVTPTVTVGSSAGWATGPNSSSTADIIRLGGTSTNTTANNTLVDITADAEL